MQGRVVAALATVGMAVVAVAPASAATFGQARERLAADARGEVVVRDGGDHVASFVAARVGAEELGVEAGAGAREVAEAALERYDGLLGAQELRFEGTVVDGLGQRHVTFAPLRGGVPVLHGEVTVHLDDGSDGLRAISASVAGDAGGVAGASRLDAAQAEEAARERVPGGRPLEETRLVAWAGPLADADEARLAWAVDLLSADGTRHELVVVDALSGAVLGSEERIHDALKRRTYSGYGWASIPGWLVLTEDEGSTQDSDTNAAHALAGDVYAYYRDTFGRDSWNGRGGVLRQTTRYGQGYRNAFWNGRQAVYGDGFATRDVVAHELTHAVTQAEGGLVYRGESGALNEALADMAAWDVDPEDPTIGEDLPGGAIRDLEQPWRFGLPWHTSQWTCMTEDDGGVHVFSAILSRAYVNLVAAVGRSAAQRVRYRAQTTYLRPTAGFADARAAFEAAARDLDVPDDAVGGAFEAQGVTRQWSSPC